MNINIRKADRNDRHTITKLMKKFRDEYSNTGAHIKEVNDDSTIDVTKRDISRGIVYMILLDKQVIGCVDVEYRLNINTGEIVSTGEFITNLYIKSQYRNQNIASLVRKQLESYNVYGTNITVQRLLQKKLYWLNQGYTHWAIDPREQRTDHHALIRITKYPDRNPEYLWDEI